MDAGHAPQSPVTPLALRLLWPEMEPEAPDQPLDNESALIAERRAKVFRLYTRGMSIRGIAEHESVKCSKSTVGRDVQHVAESYRLIALQDAAAHLARDWPAWRRSRWKRGRHGSGARASRSRSRLTRGKGGRRTVRPRAPRNASVTATRSSSHDSNRSNGSAAGCWACSRTMARRARRSCRQ